MAIYGVDLSHWNGMVDYSQFITNRNSDFVIAKATQKDEFVDNMFMYHAKNCCEYNIMFGAYHYLVDSDIDRQADHFLNVVHNAKSEFDMYGRILLAVDVEDTSLIRLGSRAIAINVEKFVRRVYDKTGIYPLIYTSAKFMSPTLYDGYISTHCGGWIANWSQMSGRHDLNLSIIQYTNRGIVKGIKGNVDLDKAYMTREAWYRFARGDNG